MPTSTDVAQITYPQSDGQPMADNTKQFRWIVTIQGGLDALFRENPQVFVAGDLLWYPVEGHPEICMAPDVLVAFGRPKGDRGSYMQWEEGGIAPQVVFEIRSPGNTIAVMTRKFRFAERKKKRYFAPVSRERTSRSPHRHLLADTPCRGVHVRRARGSGARRSAPGSGLGQRSAPAAETGHAPPDGGGEDR